MGQDSANYALHFAAEKGSVSVVAKVIAFSAKVDSLAMVTRETPLMVASRQGHVEVIKALIFAGASVENRLSRDGGTPLAIAASHGEFAAVTALKKIANANVTAKNVYGETPLYNAARRLDLAAASFLYDAGPGCINVSAVDGRTPLLAAVRAGPNCLPMVVFLLERGASVFTCDINGVMVFSYAAARGFTHVITTLLENNKVTTRSRDAVGKTMLYYAKQNGHENTVRVLLKYHNAE